MRKVKVVVFQAMEILCTLATKFAPKECPTVIRHHPGEPPKTPYYSTGKLERALAEGYEVWVLRTIYTPEADDWWLAQVPADNVLDAREAINHPTSQAAVDLMHQLFALLDLPWDNSVTGYREGLDALVKHGVVRGYMLEPFVPEQPEALDTPQDATALN